jgi:hypothetical protein
MMFDQVAVLALLILAAGAGSVSLTPLLVAAPAGHSLAVVETTIGTTAVCASVGLAFQRYGVVAALAMIAIALVVNRALSTRDHPNIERVCAWSSAAALLAFIAKSQA